MADSDITVTSLTATAAGPGAIAVMPVTTGGSCLPYLALAAVEIWGGATNNRASATKVGDTVTGFVHGDLLASATRYYWARARDVSGNLGDWFPASATAGISAATSSTEIPDGSITGPKLADGTIPSSKLISVNADKISVTSLSAISANLGTMTAGYLTAGVAYLGTVNANQISATSLAAISANLGTVTAGTLSANVSYLGAVTAAQINAISLSAISANLGEVTAGRLIGTTINGGTITGSTIRTATGSRTALLDGNKFAMYGATGEERVIFDTTGLTVAGFTGNGNESAVYITQYSPGSNAHCIRINNGRGSAAGRAVIGSAAAAGGWAFYSEGGGYGPFTGSHDAFVAKGSNLRPAPGDIVVDLRVLVRGDIDDTLTEIEASSGAGQRGVVGVVSRIGPFDPERTVAALPMDDRRNVSPIRRHLAEHYDMAVINGVGEGQINVCGEGGDIEIGDLIIASSIPGKGMRQPDDTVRSNTVARARERMTFSGPDDIKRVAVIYLCG